VSINHKVSCAQIAQFEGKEANQNVCDIFCFTNDAHKIMLQELSMVNKMLEEADELDDDSQQILRDQRKDLVHQLKEMSCRKKELFNESDRLLASNRNGKRQIEALYDQVGDFNKDKFISVDDMPTTQSELTHSTEPSPPPKSAQSTAKSTEVRPGV